MYCPNCGATIAPGQQYCNACGSPANPSPYYGQPYPSFPVVNEYSLPSQYRPLSAWAYFGYMLLFSIPVVGFILLIIYSFSDDNINRRNFARSYWCAFLIAAIVCVVVLIPILILGLSY